MKNKDRYPGNWNEIAFKVKEKANWTCQKCGLQCYPPEYLRRFIKDRSEKAKLTLTVHHCDYDPSNNHPSNLRALCSACHLSYHQGRRGNIHPNQLKLNLGI